MRAPSRTATHPSRSLGPSRSLRPSRYAAAAAVGAGFLTLTPVGAQLQYNQAFRMDEVREESLARSAAPPAVSNEADVYVLASEGYERVVKGTNGFACLVLRAIAQPGVSAENWTRADVIAPICYNPDASATELPAQLLRARLHASGIDQEEVERTVREAFWRGELTPPSGLPLGYMQSAGHASGRGTRIWPSSIVLFTPYVDAGSLGEAPEAPAAPKMIGAPGTLRSALRIPQERMYDPVTADATDADGLRPLGAEERAALLREARDNERRLLRAVAGLTADEWTTRAQADGWSVAEALEHIAAAEAAMVRMVRNAIETARTTGGDGGFRSAQPDVRARLRLLDRGTRFRTVPAMVPSGRFGDAAGAMSAWRSARNELEALALELDPVARTVGFPHPMFTERLDGYQYLLQATGHADRHLEQIEEILATLRGISVQAAQPQDE